eukprot:TRINITY_DN4162_c0_g1_i1.p1 TRINITY_DN4162_c0_g1~~TRINITY_DN4162_c0_g1_i1.p1  ORF type:complete len:1196 (+),score=358.92 TRINITY_DN4162_c0_g1_i1:122-3589(+)
MPGGMDGMDMDLYHAFWGGPDGMHPEEDGPLTFDPADMNCVTPAVAIGVAKKRHRGSADPALTPQQESVLMSVGAALKRRELELLLRRRAGGTEDRGADGERPAKRRRAEGAAATPPQPPSTPPTPHSPSPAPEPADGAALDDEAAFALVPDFRRVRVPYTLGDMTSRVRGVAGDWITRRTHPSPYTVQVQNLLEDIIGPDGAALTAAAAAAAAAAALCAASGAAAEFLPLPAAGLQYNALPAWPRAPPLPAEPEAARALAAQRRARCLEIAATAAQQKRDERAAQLLKELPLHCHRAAQLLRGRALRPRRPTRASAAAPRSAAQGAAAAAGWLRLSGAAVRELAAGRLWAEPTLHPSVFSWGVCTLAHPCDAADLKRCDTTSVLCRAAAPGEGDSSDDGGDRQLAEQLWERWAADEGAEGDGDRGDREAADAARRLLRLCHDAVPASPRDRRRQQLVALARRLSEVTAHAAADPSATGAVSAVLSDAVRWVSADRHVLRAVAAPSTPVEFPDGEDEGEAPRPPPPAADPTGVGQRGGGCVLLLCSLGQRPGPGTDPEEAAVRRLTEWVKQLPPPPPELFGALPGGADPTAEDARSCRPLTEQQGLDLLGTPGVLPAQLGHGPRVDTVARALEEFPLSLRIHLLHVEAVARCECASRRWRGARRPRPRCSLSKASLSRPPARRSRGPYGVRLPWTPPEPAPRRGRSPGQHGSAGEAAAHAALSCAAGSLNHFTAAAVAARHQGDAAASERASNCVFTLLLLVLWLRHKTMGAEDAAALLVALLRGGAQALGRFLSEQHIAALPLLLAALASGLFPVSLPRLWALSDGMPLSAAWHRAPCLPPPLARLAQFGFEALRGHQWQSAAVGDSLIMAEAGLLAAPCRNPRAAQCLLSDQLQDGADSLALWKALAYIAEHFGADEEDGSTSGMLAAEDVYASLAGAEGLAAGWALRVDLWRANLALRRGDARGALRLCGAGAEAAGGCALGATLDCARAALRGDEGELQSALRELARCAATADPDPLQPACAVRELLGWHSDEELCRAALRPCAEAQQQQQQQGAGRWGLLAAADGVAAAAGEGPGSPAAASLAAHAGCGGWCAPLAPSGPLAAPESWVDADAVFPAELRDGAEPPPSSRSASPPSSEGDSDEQISLPLAD